MKSAVLVVLFSLLFSTTGEAADTSAARVKCEQAKKNGPAKYPKICAGYKGQRDYAKPAFEPFHNALDACMGDAKMGSDIHSKCMDENEPLRLKGVDAQIEWDQKWGKLEYMCDPDASRRVFSFCPGVSTAAVSPIVLTRKNDSSDATARKKAESANEIKRKADADKAKKAADQARSEENARLATRELKEKTSCLAEFSRGHHPCGCSKYETVKGGGCSR